MTRPSAKRTTIWSNSSGSVLACLGDGAAKPPHSEERGRARRSCRAGGGRARSAAFRRLRRCWPRRYPRPRATLGGKTMRTAVPALFRAVNFEPAAEQRHQADRDGQAQPGPRMLAADEGRGREAAEFSDRHREFRLIHAGARSVTVTISPSGEGPATDYEDRSAFHAVIGVGQNVQEDLDELLQVGAIVSSGMPVSSSRLPRSSNWLFSRLLTLASSCKRKPVEPARCAGSPRSAKSRESR